MNEPNTIWAKAYTPSGIQVGITIAIENGQLKPASELDAMIANAGYLVSMPGAEPGEVVETITHVMRRTKYGDDGVETPIIAYFIDNSKWVNKYDHQYLDPEKVAAFEEWAGLKISDIPKFDGNWIERNSSPQSKKYIIELPKPRQVACKMGTWKNPKNGETGEKMKIQRFIGITATNNVSDTETSPRPEWLNNADDITKVKERLAFLGLDVGEELVQKARNIVDANMNSYKTSDFYLVAIENSL